MKRRPPSLKMKDWRNPNMPVLMRVSYDGGKTFTLADIEPDAVQKYYVNKLANGLISNPDWYNDPTYNLRKKK